MPVGTYTQSLGPIHGLCHCRRCDSVLAIPFAALSPIILIVPPPPGTRSARMNTHNLSINRYYHFGTAAHCLSHIVTIVRRCGSLHHLICDSQLAFALHPSTPVTLAHIATLSQPPSLSTSMTTNQTRPQPYITRSLARVRGTSHRLCV